MNYYFFSNLHMTILQKCGHMVDQDVMKTSNTNEEIIKDLHKEQESRFVKVKRMFTDSLSKKSHVPSNYEEAKSMCKARKRKERQESTGSNSQERKVIRSNSEEKLTDLNGSDHNNKKDIRRVVSHEDFQKKKTLQEHNETITVSFVEMNINTKCSPSKNINLDSLSYDDCEHERRRYHERFAPLLTQRGRRSTPGRKYKAKHFSKTRIQKDDSSYKENGGCANNKSESKNKTKSKETVIEDPIYIPETKQKSSQVVATTEPNSNINKSATKDETEVSSSSSSTPVSSTLDLTTLHQQIDSSEPMPSSSSQEITDQTETMPSSLVASNRLLSSPRNSIMVTHRIYLDPNVQKSNNSLNKEQKSPLDKKLKHLSKQINSLKRKIKSFDEEFLQTFGYKPSQADKMNDKNVRKLCFDLGKLKKDYKQLKGENTNLKAFNSEDSPYGTNNESSLQKTFTEIEEELNDKRISCNRCEEIDEMNNEEIVEEKVSVQKALLYLESIYGRPTTKVDRDLVRPLYDRYRTLKRLLAKISMNGGIANELATILEHETMDFVSSPPQLSENEGGKLAASTSTDSESDVSLGESFHTLTIDQLLKLQKELNEEKKKLKRSLKEFENDVHVKTGRKVQKDEKVLMAGVYTTYKQTKAKLRLLDALVSKHNMP